MHEIYRSIVSFLVWLSADPAAIDAERPKAAAAVAAARASLTTEAPAPAPDPQPKPPTPAVCKDCNGTGVQVMPDGHRVKCHCQQAEKPAAPKPPQAPCPDGKCPKPSGSVLR